MTVKLTTTVSSIKSLSNIENACLLDEFYQFMKSNNTSDRYQNNNLKTIIGFAKFLGNTSFSSIKKKDEIIIFLDTKIKNSDIDPDKRWITTWNDYLGRIKFFYRWLYNHKKLKQNGQEPSEISNWENTGLC